MPEAIVAGAVAPTADPWVQAMVGIPVMMMPDMTALWYAIPARVGMVPAVNEIDT